MFKTAWELLNHKYIRSGETLYTQIGDDISTRDKVTVKIEGWGKYAPVRRSDAGYIRRDIIKWVDEWYEGHKGYWLYRYDF